MNMEPMLRLHLFFAVGNESAMILRRAGMCY